MSELDLRKAIQCAVSPHGVRLFRNQVGQGWVGNVTTLANGDVLIKNPRRIGFGLCLGSADLIGWSPGGVFTSVEIKTGRVPVTTEQQAWCDAVARTGGLSGIARSVDDALKICLPDYPKIA